MHAFIHRLDVRFRDCDALGHVNNAVYLTYLEQARYHWLRDQLQGWRVGEASMILARAECDFKAQVSHSDILEIRLGVEGVGRSSFTLGYEVVKVPQEVLAARARTVQVMYDYVAGRSIPIPSDLRSWLEAAGENR